MRTPNEFDTEREDELFTIEANTSPVTPDNKRLNRILFGGM